MQVGYGDIVPHTKYEIGVTIVSMIIGGFIFGTIVGNLAELSKRANADELMRQKAVAKVQTVFNSGLARGALAPDLIRRIKSHYRFHHEHYTTTDVGAFIKTVSRGARRHCSGAGPGGGDEVNGSYEVVHTIADTALQAQSVALKCRGELTF